MLMIYLLEWAKHNPLAAITTVLLVIGTLATWLQSRAAGRSLAIAERAADAAEQQLELSRAEILQANSEKDSAMQLAQMAEKRASLAHEQMKAALKPMLLLLRVQGTVVQRFFVENQGIGFAEEITWDYLPPAPPPAKNELNPGRLACGFIANSLAPTSGEEFQIDYARFQQVGLLLRYKSADGRYFDTHISMPTRNGAFRHIHLPTSS